MIVGVDVKLLGCDAVRSVLNCTGACWVLMLYSVGGDGVFVCRFVFNVESSRIS